MLTSELEASKSSNFVRQVFVNELPRLYNIFSGLFARIQVRYLLPSRRLMNESITLV
jgi:hypothetical protein